MDCWAELRQRMDRVANPWIAQLLRDVVLPREERLRAWPAAVTVHHACPGGLLEHIVKVAESADALACVYGADRDIVFAGAVLHDIAKIDELTVSDAGETAYSREGNLLGHITMGVIVIRDAARRITGFPEDLRACIEHLIVSHHGARALGSPVEPMTVEAFILSAVDDLDAKIHQVRRHTGEDTREGEFTAFHPRLRRVFFKPSGR